MFKRSLLHASVAICGLVFAGACAAQSIEVKDAWLKRNCLDKGTADYPLYGKEFEACLRKQIESLPALDTSKREFFGERYDPAKYVECRLRPESRNNSACNVYVLRRREWPEYWPENAMRPKWPEAPKESVYRHGMKPKEYWEALCKAEAGEFVARTVKDVDGFILIRPRGRETDFANQDRSVLEDPYGFLETGYSDTPSRPGEIFFKPSRVNYRFVETGSLDSEGRLVWISHELDPVKVNAALKQPSDGWSESNYSSLRIRDRPRSKYGVIWREIRRERDRELSVVGGELVVFDLLSGETLALRRGFAVDSFAVRELKRQHFWRSSWGCPHMARDFLSLEKFIKQVLIPRDI